MYKKILLPVDGTKYSQDALAQAKDLAVCCGSEIILIHIMENTPEDYPSNPYKFSRELNDKLRNEHRLISDKIIENSKKELEDLNTPVSAVQKEGLPYIEIVNYAEEIDAELIIIGSSGTSGVLGMMGSVARKVAINSKKSVLVVK